MELDCLEKCPAKYFWSGVGITFCVCLPVCLLISGACYLAWPNTRQNLIDEFNTAVDEWVNVDRSSFSQGFSIDDLNTSVGGVRVVSTADPWIKWEGLSSEHDDPPPKKYDAYYFHTTLSKGSVSYDTSDPPYTGTFYVSDRTIPPAITSTTSVSVSSSPFRKSSHRYYTTCDRDEEQHTENCWYDWEQCADAGGTYIGTSLSENSNGIVTPNCFWYYYLSRFCILVDPTTGRLSTFDPSTESHGCFSRTYFSHSPSLRYDSSTYLQTAHSTKTWNDFTIDFEIRSPKDPALILNDLTGGRYDFGSSGYSRFITGIILISVGSGIGCLVCCVCCSVCICLMGLAGEDGCLFIWDCCCDRVLFCCRLVQRGRRRGGNYENIDREKEEEEEEVEPTVDTGKEQPSTPAFNPYGFTPSAPTPMSPTVVVSYHQQRDDEKFEGTAPTPITTTTTVDEVEWGGWSSGAMNASNTDFEVKANFVY